MSRLSTLAALLHAQADAARSAHPHDVARAVSEGFAAIAVQLESAHEAIVAGLRQYAAHLPLSAADREALEAAGLGDILADLPPAAEEGAGLEVFEVGQPAEQAAPDAALLERAQRLSDAFCVGYGCSPIPWDKLTPGERAGWLAAAGMQ